MHATMVTREKLIYTARSKKRGEEPCQVLGPKKPCQIRDAVIETFRAG